MFYTTHPAQLRRESCKLIRRILVASIEPRVEFGLRPSLHTRQTNIHTVNPTVENTVETSSNKMDSGSEVDQRDRCLKPSTKLLDFIKKQIFIGIKVDQKENGRSR